MPAAHLDYCTSKAQGVRPASASSFRFHLTREPRTPFNVCHILGLCADVESNRKTDARIEVARYAYTAVRRTPGVPVGPDGKHSERQEYVTLSTLLAKH